MEENPELRASIVRIFSKDNSEDVVGAGFIVGEKWIVTCAHVAKSALNITKDIPEKPQRNVSLDFPFVKPGDILKAHVHSWHPEPKVDIALLKLDDMLPKRTGALRLDLGEPKCGKEVQICGFPDKNPDGVWTIGETRLMAAHFLQIDGKKEYGFWVDHGLSGAPVWDDESKGVVGMISVFEKAAEIKSAFAVPTDMLIEKCPELKRIVQKKKH